MRCKEEDKDLSNMPASAEREQFASGLFFVRANLVFANGDFASWVASAAQLQDELPQNPLFYHLNYNATEPFIRKTRFGLKGMMSDETELVGKQFSRILETHGWGDSLINKYVVQALAEWQQGNKPQALACLHEALAIGERNLYVRSFLDEGPAMHSLLLAYQQREKARTEPFAPAVSPACVARLLALFPQTGATIKDNRSAPLAEPLTGKERIILSMLGKGATNKEIAETLGNTGGTVKVYLHGIYGKLGVANRTQALLKAQELSLLETEAPSRVKPQS
ncbi:response regulator transcription factor [Brevibacillus sp. NSP2.1]|nr:response regulator transcription factor [Brevibacillus sp. NSP2.1]